jgi:thiol-activated cytolysin
MTEAVRTYLQSLKYDPRDLLSVEESGSTTPLPPKTKTSAGNSVIVCTNTNRSLQKELSDVAILSPTAGVVFPGALVRANRRLAEGRPDPIGVARAPVTIRVDLPGLGARATRVVEKATASNVQAAIDEVLELWNAEAGSQGYVNKARSFLSIAKAYSRQQLALDLGFSSKWTGGDVSSKLNVASSGEMSVAVAFFKQVFYSVVFDTPTDPSSVFAPDVDLADIKAVIDDDNPPAYVRSVDYGRIIMVKMETASSETKMSMEGALKQVTSGGVDVAGSVDGKFAQIVDNSTFTVVALGGNAEAAASITQPGDLGKLHELIQRGAQYTRQNPGAPISYTVAFLKDNQIATLGFTTNYTEQECVQHNNGMVQVEHAGVYVAKFAVSWEEQDQNGAYTARTWESGAKTAGFTAQIDLPGDARNVKIEAWAATGLVWDPWGLVFSEVEKGPSNLRYVARGTTLMRSWEKKKP